MASRKPESPKKSTLAKINMILTIAFPISLMVVLHARTHGILEAVAIGVLIGGLAYYYYRKTGKL